MSFHQSIVLVAKTAAVVVVLGAFSVLAALAAFELTGNELTPPPDSESLEELIFQSYTDDGFARIDSVELNGCELKIAVKYDRICPPPGTDTGMFNYETILVHLDELSGRKEDSRSVEGELGADFVFWEIDPSIIQLHRQVGQLIDEFREEHPRPVTSESKFNETWAYTETVLNQFGVKSRSVPLHCSGQKAFQHFNGTVGISFKPKSAETVLEELRKYKFSHCPSPID